MLHELLLALSGHGGSIFIEKADFKFDIINDIPFFHPSEESIIRQLLNIASNFKAVCGFSKKYENTILQEEKSLSGQYITALASSFCGVIDEYESIIISLENDLLENPNLPLSHILLMLQDQSLVLAAIAQLISEVNDDAIYGCKILEVVHNHVVLSVGRSKQVLLQVEQAVHVVLYEQLTHWLLYGLLLDPHKELFIQVGTSTVEKLSTSITSDVEALSLADNDQPKTFQEIKLRPEMLPNHIPLEVAEKILFIGEVILEFESENKKNQELMTSTMLVTSHSGQVLKGREEEFLLLIKNLIEAPKFCLSNFSSVIETIRNCVSEKLWNLVMESGLLEELTDIKSIYLLGRGELFQAFISSATPRINHSLAGSSYLNSLMKAAGRQVLLDEVLEKFTLSLEIPNPHSKVDIEKNVWHYLKISYNATWPLHRLFGTYEQDKYNRIFVFLLSVRRAQYRLQHVWISQMQNKQINSSPYETMIWTIRHHMTLLIDNLQYYLQVDVLESQYWQLITEISKTRDYQKLVAAHHNFLSSIHYQCFLNNHITYKSISSLITQIHEFCQFMEKDIDKNISLTKNFLLDSSFESKVSKMHSDFEGASRRLFDILSSLKQIQGSHHTSQLIMRIDYNKYYSLNKSNIKSN